MHLNFTEHSHIVYWNVQFSPTIHTNNNKIHQYDSLSGYGSIPGLVVVLNNIWIKYNVTQYQKCATKSLKQCILLCSLSNQIFILVYIGSNLFPFCTTFEIHLLLGVVSSLFAPYLILFQYNKRVDL